MARNLLRDAAGSTVVEMAMVAPFLALMLVGMVDLSRAYGSKLALEQAAQRTIEKVAQGQIAESDADDFKAALKTEAATAAGVAESAVTPDVWLECEGARKDFNTGACDADESFARYASVDITKKYTPLFSVKKFAGANADGTYTIRGEAGVRLQ